MDKFEEMLINKGYSDSRIYEFLEYTLDNNGEVMYLRFSDSFTLELFPFPERFIEFVGEFKKLKSFFVDWEFYDLKIT